MLSGVPYDEQGTLAHLGLDQKTTTKKHPKLKNKVFLEQPISLSIALVTGVWGERHALCAHRVPTVHLFYLDNLLDAIVLLCYCPVRCGVVELVPHFNLHALRTTLYILSLGR